MTRVARRPDYWPEFFAKSLQNSNMDFSPDLPFFEGREPGLASPKNSAGTDAMGRWGDGAGAVVSCCPIFVPSSREAFSRSPGTTGYAPNFVSRSAGYDIVGNIVFVWFIVF